jgi:hypothetical protein
MLRPQGRPIAQSKVEFVLFQPGNIEYLLTYWTYA